MRVASQIDERLASTSYPFATKDLRFVELSRTSEMEGETAFDEAEISFRSLACCRFGGHLDKVFTRSEVLGWDEGHSAASSSSRR